MNEPEALAVVTWLNRAGLLWAMENQAEVWADALGDIHGPTALEAAKEIAKTRTSDQRAITPGDIRKHVTTIRAKRLQGVPSPQPPVELEGDPVREKRWTRLRTYAIGDGMTIEAAETYADHHMKIVRLELPKVAERFTAHLKGIPE